MEGGLRIAFAVCQQDKEEVIAHGDRTSQKIIGRHTCQFAAYFRQKNHGQNIVNVLGKRYVFHPGSLFWRLNASEVARRVVYASLIGKQAA